MTPKKGTLRDVDYKTWITMSPERKKEVSWSWNIYAGEGAPLAKKAAKQLRGEFRDKVENVSVGLYHGGLYALSVKVKKGVRVKLPDVFEGFMVKRCSG